MILGWAVFGISQTVSVKSNSTSFSKKEGQLGSIYLSISPTHPMDVTVNYTITPAYASDIVDSGNGSVIIKANDTQAVIKFFAIKDTNTESAEIYTFTLTSANMGYAPGTSKTATITITDSAASAPASNTYPYYTIAKVRGANKNNVPDSLNVYCTLKGRIIGVNQKISKIIDSFHQFSMYDRTGSIGIFNDKKYYGTVVNEGDAVVIKGKISQYSGLGQIEFKYTGDTIYVTTTDTAATNVTTPKVSRQVMVLNDASESDLVYIRRVSYVSGTWASSGTGSNFNYIVKDSLNNQFSIRFINFDARFGANPLIVSGKFYKITGLGGQYDTSATHPSGYQLLPRRSSDIQEITVTPPPPNAISLVSSNINSINVYPNPSLNETLNVLINAKSISKSTIALTDMNGRIVYSNSTSLHMGDNYQTIDTKSFSSGKYVLQVEVGSQKETRIVVIQ